MKIYYSFLILCLSHAANAQIFLLNEGSGNGAGPLGVMMTLRASFNDGKLWPSVKLANGYSLTDKEFDVLRAKYVQYFPDDRLIKSLMLSSGPIDKSFVRWTLGMINPDKTITIYGQLIVSFKGVDPVLDSPLISNIQLKSPSEIKAMNARVIQEIYAKELEKRKNLPALPPPLPRPDH